MSRGLPLIRKTHALYEHLHRLKPREVSVYVALVGHANAEGVCWPSVDTLAEVCGLDRKTVIKAAEDLERHGMIEKRRGRREVGTVYRLIPEVPKAVLQDGSPKSKKRYFDTIPKYQSCPRRSTKVVQSEVPKLGLDSIYKDPPKKNSKKYSLPAGKHTADRHRIETLLKLAGVKSSKAKKLLDTLTLDRLLRLSLKAMSRNPDNLAAMLVTLIDDGDTGEAHGNYLGPPPIDTSSMRVCKAIELLLKHWPDIDRDKAMKAREHLARTFSPGHRLYELAEHISAWIVPYIDGDDGPIFDPAGNPVLALELFEQLQRMEVAV